MQKKSKYFINSIISAYTTDLKINLYKASLLLLFFALCISYCSCSDTPTSISTSSNNVDTSYKYTWTIDTVSGYYSEDIYTADSNDVFVTGTSPLFYNGTTYTQINMMDPSFFCNRVIGYDKNNLFFGGGTTGATLGDPIIKKWTNGNISSHTLVADSGEGISDIFVVGADECWIATNSSSKVYHLNAGNLTLYNLDRGQNEGSFFRDALGNLFVFARKSLGGDDFEVNYYKFGNNSFQLIKSEQLNLNNILLFYRRCGENMLSSRPDGIYYFDGSKWVKLCETQHFKVHRIEGNSLNNLICYGQSDALPWQIYIWNGLKWTMEGNENIYHYLGASSTQISSYQNYVNMILNTTEGSCIHLKGKLK